jgi:hypothetical protein
MLLSDNIYWCKQKHVTFQIITVLFPRTDNFLNVAPCCFVSGSWCCERTHYRLQGERVFWDLLTPEDEDTMLVGNVRNDLPDDNVTS